MPVQLRFSPEDYHVTMSLLSSLNEGASTRPPPISPKENDTQVCINTTSDTVITFSTNSVITLRQNIKFQVLFSVS